VDELAPVLGRRQACQVVMGRSRASHYRARRPGRCTPATPRARSARALRPDEVEEILSMLNSERFCDKAPAEVWATLLDEGVYLASIS
jgi:putative transposase